MTQPPPPGGWPPPRPVAPPPVPAPLHRVSPPPGGPPPTRTDQPGTVPPGTIPPGPVQPGPQQTGPVQPLPSRPGAGQQWPPPWPQHPPPAAVMPPPQATGPQHGGPWGPPPGRWAPPPPRRSNGPVVAGALLSVVVLGIALVGVVAASSRPDRVDVGYSGGYTTYTATATPRRTTAATTTTSATTTASAPTSTRSSSASRPSSGPKSVIALGDNPIHSANIGAFDVPGCALPSMDYSPAGQDRFLRAALPCIEQMWRPAFTRSNLPYQPAELMIVTTPTQSPCGTVKPDGTARYCEGVVYWTANAYAGEQSANSPNHPGKYLGQLAHEYGHHVQWLAGILKASSNAQYEKGGWDTPAGLDVNRRKELQATCFGGMALAPLSRGAIPMDVISMALQDAGNRGDWPDNGLPRDHGSPERNAAWAKHGYDTNSTAECNTWLSPAEDVA
ncbi:neutral zinc metallopeptidase [Umezawaea beigongshangensis]|uniref:neutral zinc metallopeptidase n=1 Tax=Umezawaea beigongshangensis TaxID=2780383 RepID=UPI0022773927|nr:neutral zinc metallopeptidase [Umezawaea beigongshangensis]